MTRRRRGLVLALVAGALAAGAPLAAAEKAPDPKDRLQAVERAIAVKHAERERLRQQQEALAGELETLRRDSVAAAGAAQQQERAIATTERELFRLGSEGAQKQRGLDDSRAQQAELLGALERLARDPPEALAAAPEGPIDQIRGGVLLAAAVPALAARARALKERIQALDAVKAEIGAKRAELVAHRRALEASRRLVAQMILRKSELQRQTLQDASETEARLGALSVQASDLQGLIKGLEAERERRDKALLARRKPALRAAADPMRPKDLRSFDAAHGAMILPASGHIVRHYGDPDEFGSPSKGLDLAALGGAEVVAPFDGRVEYAGPFRGYGLILIIRHGGGYHSLLAGLGRIDAKVGQWVLAGEPVGATAEATAEEKGAESTLYFELRRDGRPVDPSPWLAHRDDKTAHDDAIGDDRVRE